jgi:hypothetical protein
MPEDNRNWFIRERSDALASLILTSRPDVSVQGKDNLDDGVDLVVGLKEGESVDTKLFVVQVKGTVSSDAREWTENVKPLYKSGNFYLPACVFIINVRENKASYAWVAEPHVKGNIAELAFFDHPDFHSLDEGAVDGIVNRVRDWYNALPRKLVPQQAS